MMHFNLKVAATWYTNEQQQWEWKEILREMKRKELYEKLKSIKLSKEDEKAKEAKSLRIYWGTRENINVVLSAQSRLLIFL